jgi:hypothetical protein
LLSIPACHYYGAVSFRALKGDVEFALRIFIPVKAAQHRLHLTASGADYGGLLVEKAILRSLVSFKSAAGEPLRWAERGST